MISNIRNSSSNTLHLRVCPGAGKNEIVGFTGGVLQVKIAAPPLQGKANRELTAFLSQMLGISRSSLTILKGHTSRNKVIAIDGLSREDAIKRLTT
ncbi:DUF167 domain-containing protein [Chloroflexota bacterium]